MSRICIDEVCVRSSVGGRSASVPARGRRFAGRGRRRAARARERLPQVERVLHVARGVVRRHVQGFEVVVVVLGLRPVEDLVALAREDRLEALSHHGQGMAAADARRAAGERDVDGPGRSVRPQEFAASRAAIAASM